MGFAIEAQEGTGSTNREVVVLGVKLDFGLGGGRNFPRPIGKNCVTCIDGAYR